MTEPERTSPTANIPHTDVSKGPRSSDPDDVRTKPFPHYVLTLSGILEFTTKGGETFTIKPGDVLLAEDHTGTGHKWRLLNDDPWRRAYVIFAPGAETQFMPD